MSEKSWTEEEIKILEDNYNKYPIREIQKTLLPKKSIKQIYNYAYKIGLAKFKRWTNEELDILKEFYGKETIGQTSERLPERSFSEIAHKASSLGLTDRKEWSEEELNILKEFYPTEGIKVLERLPGRSKSAVNHMARRLGLRRCAQWAPDEDEIIRKYYREESATSLSKRLPGRTPINIGERARSLGLAKRSKGIPWTQEELDILKDFYRKISKIELLKKLPNRTYNSITTQATLLGLTEKRQKAPKTSAPKQDESAIIEERQASPEETGADGEMVDAQQESDEIPVAEGVNPEKPDVLVVVAEGVNPEKPDVLVADENGDPKQKRKKKHIRKKRASKVRKTRKADIWTEEEDEIVRTRFNKDDLSVLMTKLPNHTLTSIRRRARKLGVTNNQSLVNWTKEEIEILEKYYPIEGTAVLYRLKKHSLNSIRVVAKVLKIKNNRITEPWAYKEDYLACQHYLSHVNDWFEEKVIDELLSIFISNGYLKHGRTTLHMKLANCSYIHTGIGLEHASNQNIRAYKKLTGVGFVRRAWRRFCNFLRRIFHVKKSTK